MTPNPKKEALNIRLINSEKTRTAPSTKSSDKSLRLETLRKEIEHSVFSMPDKDFFLDQEKTKSYLMSGQIQDN